MLNDVLNNLKNSSKFNDLYNDMSKYQKKLFNNFLDNPDVFLDYSLNDLIFDFDTYFIQELLNLELSCYLEECEKNGIKNKRNGSTKNISLTVGNKEINFNRPRLRNEKDFNSIIIPKRTRIIDDLNNHILLLYSKNNSVNDIKDILTGLFNINISTATISNFTQKIADKVFEWRNRNLKSVYFTVNIDCTYITVKDNKSLGSHKIPVYIAVGTTLSGHKEIVGMYLGNEDENKKIIANLHNEDIAESATFWTTVFNDLKDRGIKDIFYIISDGLTGIENVIKSEFPNSKYQRCIVHLVRNLKTYASKKSSKVIIHDFKLIYSAPNKELCIQAYKDFLENHKHEKTIIKKVQEYYHYILPLFDEPESIRKYIYTNNIVESANSKIKRGFYGRGALPNVESAINIIYLNLNDLESKWSKSKVKNWDVIFKELSILYKDVISDYISK